MRGEVEAKKSEKKRVARQKRERSELLLLLLPAFLLIDRCLIPLHAV